MVNITKNYLYLWIKIEYDYLFTNCFAHLKGILIFDFFTFLKYPSLYKTHNFILISHFSPWPSCRAIGYGQGATDCR